MSTDCESFLHQEIDRLRARCDSLVAVAHDAEVERERDRLKKAAERYDEVHSTRDNALTELSRELSACVNVSLDILQAARLSTTLALDQ